MSKQRPYAPPDNPDDVEEDTTFELPDGKELDFRNDWDDEFGDDSDDFFDDEDDFIEDDLFEEGNL